MVTNLTSGLVIYMTATSCICGTGHTVTTLRYERYECGSFLCCRHRTFQNSNETALLLLNWHLIQAASYQWMSCISEYHNILSLMLTSESVFSLLLCKCQKDLQEKDSYVSTDKIYTCTDHQLNAQFLYSLIIYVLRYDPRHVLSITMLIFRRSNCIFAVSGIVTPCELPYIT